MFRLYVITLPYKLGLNIEQQFDSTTIYNCRARLTIYELMSDGDDVQFQPAIAIKVHQ